MQRSLLSLQTNMNIYQHFTVSQHQPTMQLLALPTATAATATYVLLVGALLKLLRLSALCSTH
jgi:cell division septation protein DedD